MIKKNIFQSDLISKRVIFIDENIRNQFFNRLKNRFVTWSEVRRKFNIYKSRLENFRKGTLSIPYPLFLDFLSYMDNRGRSLFEKKIFIRNRNWGRVKGGISTYNNHKYIFEKGRKLGSKKRKNKVKYKFPLDMPLTLELSELIGAFIGDGFTNQYGKVYITQFTGHKFLDKSYYTEILANIIKIISPNSNPILYETKNAIRLTVYSKELYILLTKRFKLPKGKKVYKVVMPLEIINSNNQEVMNFCIRGIFDTDGSVCFDKRPTYKKPYMRIMLQMRSKNLIKQLHTLLIKAKIKARINSNSERIHINGIRNCEDYARVIGFKNKRQLSKMRI